MDKHMHREADCIFCKIVAGEIPCHKLYEDDKVLGFLDIGPVSRGHAILIPKNHAATLDALSGDDAAAIGRMLPSVGRAVVAAAGAFAWNVLQNNGKAAGQAVGHVHFHIIPRFDDAGLDFQWPAGELSGDDAVTLREKIIQQLASLI